MQSAAWLVQFIRDQAKQTQPPLLSLATVSSTMPLRVTMSGVELGNPFLLASAEIMAGIEAQAPSIVPGDTVLVAAINNQQQYAVLSKVVNV